MKYLVQIILSSNTNLNILVSKTIETIQKAGFGQVEVIKGVSHYLKEKQDMTIVQFEFIATDKYLEPFCYIHKATNDELRSYKIRISKLEYYN